MNTVARLIASAWAAIAIFVIGLGTSVAPVGAQATPAVSSSPLPPVVWQLLTIEISGSPTVVADDPSRYTVQFLEVGSILSWADCNQGCGAYQASGSQITIGPVAMTRVACPPGSLFDRFTRAIEPASSFTFIEGHLFLSPPGDFGTLVFAAHSTESSPATPDAG